MKLSNALIYGILYLLFQIYFARKASLKLMNEAGRFVCDICGVTFAHINNITRHKKAVHEKVRFPCNVCRISFCRSHLLHDHIKEKHSDRQEHFWGPIMERHDLNT